jgi:hypothetical protein
MMRSVLKTEILKDESLCAARSTRLLDYLKMRDRLFGNHGIPKAVKREPERSFI